MYSISILEHFHVDIDLGFSSSELTSRSVSRYHAGAIQCSQKLKDILEFSLGVLHFVIPPCNHQHHFVQHIIIALVLD